MERQPCVYILASRRKGTLYTGVTSALLKRIWEHKNNVVEGFTKKYAVHSLVWYEVHETMESAIKREKSIKNWERAWKIKMVEELNPRWCDLYPDLL
jgi:putative endonuclease